MLFPIYVGLLSACLINNLSSRLKKRIPKSLKLSKKLSKASEPFTYLSKKVVLRYIECGIRQELAKEYPEFKDLNEKLPYYVVNTYHSPSKYLIEFSLDALNDVIRYHMNEFLFTLIFIPVRVREWLKRRWDRKVRQRYKDSNFILSRPGTIIENYHLVGCSDPSTVPSIAPEKIRNLFIYHHLEFDYSSGMFRNMEASRIGNLSLYLDVPWHLPVMVLELSESIINDITCLEAERVKITSLIIPRSCLRNIWKMKADTMELFAEQTFEHGFSQICEDLKKGIVPFSQFHYTGFVFMTSAEINDYWNRLSANLGVGTDDGVMVKRNRILFKSVNSNLPVVISYERDLIRRYHKLSVHMGSSEDLHKWNTSNSKTSIEMRNMVPKFSRIVNLLSRRNFLQWILLAPVATFGILLLKYNLRTAYIGSSIAFYCAARFNLDWAATYYVLGHI